MPKYTVIWSIQEEADTVEEAVQLAWGSMQDLENTATYFRVINESTGEEVFQDFFNAVHEIEPEDDECERAWDDLPGNKGWQCLHDVTGCMYNDGHNTCSAEGDSLSPLNKEPDHHLPEEGEQVLIDSPNGKTVAYWIWVNEGDPENPKPDYRQWYALIDSGSPMDEPPTSWEPIP